MRDATVRRLNYGSSKENLTQNISFVTDRDVREEVSALVIPFTKHQLAGLTGRQPQAVALWHKAARTPTAASIFNLAQSIPAVQEWVARRSGMERAVQAGSYDVWIQGLYLLAAGHSADAERARAAIRLLDAASMIPEYQIPLGNLKGVSREQMARDSVALIDARGARASEQERAAMERCGELGRQIDMAFETAKEMF